MELGGAGGAPPCATAACHRPDRATAGTTTTDAHSRPRTRLGWRPSMCAAAATSRRRCCLLPLPLSLPPPQTLRVREKGGDDAHLYRSGRCLTQRAGQVAKGAEGDVGNSNSKPAKQWLASDRFPRLPVPRASCAGTADQSNVRNGWSRVEEGKVWPRSGPIISPAPHAVHSCTRRLSPPRAGCARSPRFCGQWRGRALDATGGSRERGYTCTS